jgi:hypothetical protein
MIQGISVLRFTTWVVVTRRIILSVILKLQPPNIFFLDFNNWQPRYATLFQIRFLPNLVHTYIFLPTFAFAPTFTQLVPAIFFWARTVDVVVGFTVATQDAYGTPTPMVLTNSRFVIPSPTAAIYIL